MDLNTKALELGNKYLPLFNELTTSDLQACVEADVRKLELPFLTSRELEETVLAFVYGISNDKIVEWSVDYKTQMFYRS